MEKVQQYGEVLVPVVIKEIYDNILYYEDAADMWEIFLGASKLIVY